DQDVAAEQAEGTRDDQEAVQSRPSGPSEEERAQVLDDLDAFEPSSWHPHVNDPPRVDDAPVRGPDRAARSDDSLRVVDEGLHDTEQRELVEHRVGVDEADKRL